MAGNVAVSSSSSCSSSSSLSGKPADVATSPYDALIAFLARTNTNCQAAMELLSIALANGGLAFQRGGTPKNGGVGGGGGAAAMAAGGRGRRRSGISMAGSSADGQDFRYDPLCMVRINQLMNTFSN